LGTYVADCNVLLACFLQDLGKYTFLLELEVHLSLVGLNLDKDITRRQGIARLLLPRANISRGHCRRQGRHPDNGMRRV
jgi:hypothetical protein